MSSGLPGAVQHPTGSSSRQEQLIRQIDEVTAEARRKADALQYADALKIYLHAQQLAHQASDMGREAKSWMSVCFCQQDLGWYRQAIVSCETSYKLGLQAGTLTWAGGAALNLSSLYRQSGDYALSEKEGQEGLRLLVDSPRKDFLLRDLLSLADVSIEQGRFREGMDYCDRGIRIARQAQLPDQETLLWDVRGFAFMRAGQLPEAAHALQEAQAVPFHSKDNPWLSVILGHRSELELKEGHYQEALRLNEASFQTHSRYSGRVPAYYFVHVRGEILEALKRNDEALMQYRKAVELASAWREAVPPGDSTSTQSVVYLNEVYRDFAQLAARTALERRDSELSREALEALARNRAASLREQLAASLVNRPQFGDRYFQLLSELQAAQARVTLGGDSAQDAAKLKSIRLELSELEDQSLSLSTKKEKYGFQNSLKGIQARLHQNEVLLSFCLGKNRSFIWAVTVDDVHLYELPREAEIEQRANSFAEALRNGHDDEAAGYVLSQTLFGQLSAKTWGKRNWLITEDGASAGQIPYAALSDVRGAHTKQALIAGHSLRILPSELLLLLPEAAKPQRRFVGIADPIYNLADTRFPREVRLMPTTETKSAPTATLGRLAGTEREVKAAAKLSGMPQTEILSGAEANGTALRHALEKDPEFVHFAVHVVSPEGKPQEAALALSLTAEKMPELLTREGVAAYRVPGSLVILNGCASGQGKALPSAGLIGLSRAWLLAGAAAVIVSSWPVPDDSGEFFSAFYRHLQQTVTGSLAQRAAIALQEAQQDMQRSAGYRSSPSFWAAYSIFSKE